ncbi:MAG: hypothetical protein WHX52_18865 [Anaerolineae bacterium]
MRSTSLTVNSSGARVAELRYMPRGGTRYTSGTTPTRCQQNRRGRNRPRRFINLSSATRAAAH